MEYKGFSIVKEHRETGGRTFEWTVYDKEGFLLDCFTTILGAKIFIDEVIT